MVTHISLLVVFAIVLWGLAAPGNFEKAANNSFNFLVGNFGWFYLISMFTFVVFSIWIAFSKYGSIKLGPDDSEPEYSLISWFAMLFSAGMGVGLVFWGVAEPLNHFVNPLGMEGGTAAAADFAIKKSFFHWGLHPWANYSVLALALAYIQYNGYKYRLRSS
jgi:glycine betaine transporter